MEVVKVRKQNNIGNFPNDWDVKTLGEISAIDSDNLGFNTKPDYKFMYVKLEDIDIGRLKGCSEMIFRDAPSRARRKVQKSDILISTVRPNLLSHFYFREEVHDFICSTGFSVIRCDHNIVDPAYVFFHLFGEIINKQINSTLIGSNYPAINSNDVRNLSLPIPPLPEQKAIAEVLSDVDALIASLDALIAKKRAIKQGVMQELLTGKTRLPGFTGTWIEKPLGDLGKCIRGVSYNPNRDLYSSMTNSTTMLLRANNIVEGIIDYDDVQYVDNNVVSEIQQLLKGDVLIAMSSGSRIAIGKTGTFSKTEGKYCVGAFCAVYRSQQNNFIRYLFQTNLYKRQLMNMLEGTSINNLNSGKIEGLIFAFPPTIHEQNAIAEILLDVDNEINALTSKLDKVTNIKQGMMEELLTGRIRLKGGYQ